MTSSFVQRINPLVSTGLANRTTQVKSSTASIILNSRQNLESVKRSYATIYAVKCQLSSTRHKTILNMPRYYGTRLGLNEDELLSGSKSGDRYDESAKDYICWDAKAPVKLRMGKKAPENRPPMLSQTMLRNTVEKYPDAVAVAFKYNDTVINWTYKEYYEKIQNAAKGFIKLGLRESHAVGIMAPNCPEWYLSSWAASFSGGLSAGIYYTNSPDVVAYITNHATTDILVLENLNLLQKILDGKPSIVEALPDVKHVVLIESDEEELLKAKQYGSVMGWDDVMKLGKEQSDTAINLRENNCAVNKACMYIYTSGTTGPPKGAMVSHDNLTYSCYIGCKEYEWQEGKETLCSYLPLSHIAPHVIDIYMIASVGGTAFIMDKDALRGTLIDNLQLAKPTKFLGVPRVWEKMKDKMQEAGSKAGPVQKAVVQWAKNAATYRQQEILAGRMKHSDPGSLNYRLAHKIVLSKIYKKLGLENTLLNHTSRVSGAAPIRESTKKYFESLGLFIAELYGSTETSGPISTILEKPTRNCDATCGHTFDGMEVNILDPDFVSGDGEIVIHSRNVFMGYAKDETKTKEAFSEDYWFKSGDVGNIDYDGFLKITGRIKEIIITEGGKNIAPIPIESDIKDRLSSVVSQAVVIGDKRKYLSCLLTLKVEIDPQTNLPTDTLDPVVRDWCKGLLMEQKISAEEHEIPVTTMDFIEGPYSLVFQQGIQDCIDEINSTAAFRAAEIRKFHVLKHEFSIATGEFGPTLKLKRHIVAEKYQREIDQMYQPQEVKESLYEGRISAEVVIGA